MRILALRFVPAAVMASFTAIASAQAYPPANPNIDDGFFRPQPDPSLTRPRPAERPRPTEALTAEDHAQAAKGETTSRPPDPTAVMRWTEQQMDRSEQEAAKARADAAAAPAPINGAFTGHTDERDR